MLLSGELLNWSRSAHMCRRRLGWGYLWYVRRKLLLLIELFLGYCASVHMWSLYTVTVADQCVIKILHGAFFG